MPLLSALEDLVTRSLDALPTAWEKLHFLAELRTPAAGYHHWGLEQKYGPDEARGAIAAAHGSLIHEMASTGLSRLWTSAGSAAIRRQMSVADYLDTFDPAASSLPEDLQGVPPEHYRLVVTNLSRVARHSQSSHATA